MNVEELALGNLFRISPRENEEGILFLIDIQHASVIGEMIIPRQGYHFRIKYNEILPLKINEEWLLRAGFDKVSGQENIWRDTEELIEFLLSADESGFLENGIVSQKIQFMHQLQNAYLRVTGNQLTVI